MFTIRVIVWSVLRLVCHKRSLVAMWCLIEFSYCFLFRFFVSSEDMRF